MTWVKLDDMFTVHRKVDGLSDAAFRLHVSAICWSARNLTDGWVPRGDLELVSARVRTPARFATELVDRDVWIEESDGWRIHDFLVYQKSKETVIKERAENAKRQAKFRQSHSNGRRNAVTNTVSNNTPSRPSSSTKKKGTDDAPLRGDASLPRCGHCGNPETSPYHRNVCKVTDIREPA